MGSPPQAYYKDGDPNKGLQGFEADVIKEVTSCMGVEPIFYDTTWNGCFAGLLSSKWDMAASSIFVPQRPL